MKKLNIICAIIVLAVAGAVIFIKNGKNMKNDDVAYFNLNAMENAVERVNNAVLKSRARVQELVAIENKTYMNFVRPLMDDDAYLEEITQPIFHLDSVQHSDETQKIVDEILPVLSDFGSDMSRDIGVYKGFLEIQDKEYDKLNLAQKKLVDETIRNFKIAGVDLPKDKQVRLKEISAQLSKLTNDFSNNIIDANKVFKLKITDEKLLGNMPKSDQEMARVDGGFEFSLLSPFYGPFMTYVTDRDLRAKMHNAYATRAPKNEALIPQILELRQAEAKILGYKNVADLIFENRAAPGPKQAEEFLEKIAIAAKSGAEQEIARLRARAAQDGITDLKPWDTAYYSEKLLKENYNLDENETKPYFEEKNTVHAVFQVLQEMFDIKLQERNVPKWHDSVIYYDVLMNGSVIGGFFVDLQTRVSKNSGAWQNGMRDRYVDAQNNLHLPTVVIVGNFPISKDGNPSLLSMGQVSTLFHETGHALMELMTRVDEKSLSGNSVDWDVVEFPSQFLEAFWNSPIVLKRITKHIKTGEPMPDNLITRIRDAEHFQKGLFVLRQVEFGLFDLEIHQKHNLTQSDVQNILNDTRKRISVLPVAPYDKFQNTFSHIFAGGYSAGYYSYMWAEALAADAYMVFDGNPFNKELSYKYRDIVLAQGGTKKMSDIYREFIGRDPKPDSLIKYYGLKK